MRLTRLDQKLMAGIVGLFLIPTVLAAGVLIVLYRWRAFDDAFTLLVTVVVGLATLMGYLGLIAHTVGQSLVRAIREIQLGTELVATVNPAHRLAVTTGDELQLLAEEINHLAARLEAAGQDRGRAAADVTAALDSERTRLARIVDALGEGVVVVTSAGRVSLANRAAHALVGQCRVGADLLEVFDDTSAVARSADRFRAGAASVEHFALRTRNGRVLEAVTTALVEKEGFAGLVIVLRDRAMERAPSPGDAPAPWAAGGASVTATLGLASRDEGLALFDFSLFDDMDRHVTLSDRSRPLDQLACTVLDAETTGLEPSRGDRIVSIACVRVRNGAVRRAELIDVLVNPERPIPPENARIHGITDGMVAGAPVIDAIVPAVLRFADGTVLVGHHVWFDLMFLRETTERLGVPPLTRSHPVLDTSLLSQFLHGPLGRHDLETVAARLGVPTQGRHSARGDAVMTAEILVRLFKILRKRGIGTLGEALDATRRMQARFIAVTGAP